MTPSSATPWWAYLSGLLAIVFLYDILQRKHAILHNFPIVGHLRYFLEKIGPELRQYIVANNREELPFNRRQRSWIYASSKQENNYEGFGTDQDIYDPAFVFVKPAVLPYVLPPDHPSATHPYYCPSAKTIGRHRQKPYRPPSVINVSAMSYGSLSWAAVEAMNRGVAKFGAFQNTGEGGLAPFHKQGGDVVFQFGTGYFGVRDENGHFSIDRLVDLVNDNPNVKMIEVKLSQGAKPGKGGVLPKEKITKEISEIRNVPMGKDVVSPYYHTAFSNVPELVDFVEEIAAKTGLPVGIKAAVGKMDFWHELTDIMKKSGRGPDYIVIDGGEGGTGAAPPSFADHVSLPWIFAFTKVYEVFKTMELTDKVTFIGSGKLGFPASAIMAFAMGADMVNVAREAMMSIGCIQAQRCHDNKCPTGVATNNKWLVAGLDPTLKSERLYNFLKTFTKEVMEITHACGYEHPSQFTMEDVDVSMGDNNHTSPLRKIYGYDKVPVKFEGWEIEA